MDEQCNAVAQKNGTFPSGTEAISLSLKLAKTAAEGMCVFLL